MSCKSCVFALLALLILSGCTAPEPPLSRVSPTPVPPEFQGWWREYQARAGTSYIYLSDKTMEFATVTNADRPFHPVTNASYDSPVYFKVLGIVDNALYVLTGDDPISGSSIYYTFVKFEWGNGDIRYQEKSCGPPPSEVNKSRQYLLRKFTDEPCPGRTMENSWGTHYTLGKMSSFSSREK